MKTIPPRQNPKRSLEAAGASDPPTPAFAAWRALLFLRRNLLRIVLIALPLAALSFGAFWFLFDKYSATAVLMVEPRESRVAEHGGVLGGIGADGAAIESLTLIAKTDAFLGALVDRFDLTRDPYFKGKGATPAAVRDSTTEKLRGASNVSRRGVTYLIEATFNAPSAELAAQLANAAAQKIIDDQSKLRSGLNAAAAQDIAARLGAMRERVARAEEAAAALKAKLKVTDAGQGGTLLERRVAELNQQWALAAAKTAEARARVAQLRRAETRAGEGLAPSKETPVLDQLREDFARLTRQFADRSTVLGARHPDVLTLRAQLADVQRQIGAEASRMVATARTEALEAEQRERALANEVERAQRESGELGPQKARLDELDREAKAERSIYEELLKRQRELTETGGLDPSDIRLVSAALPPSKTYPKPTILAAAAAAIGLFAGLAYALARELLRDTLRTSRDVERRAGVEVAGLAPLLTRTDGGEARRRRRPDIGPWLGDLCATLAGELRGGEARSILVASARAGEGRSTVALTIARYFAEGGERVLLVEADRKKPAAPGKGRFGLIDVLERGEGLRQAFVERPADGYTLLPFGGAFVDDSASTSALMSGAVLRATLNLCRQWFDVVVIDGPAVLEASHARLLALEADLILCVVEWDKTSSAEVNEALDRLDSDAAVALFNKVDLARFGQFDPAQSRRLAAQGRVLEQAA